MATLGTEPDQRTKPFGWPADAGPPPMVVRTDSTHRTAGGALIDLRGRMGDAYLHPSPPTAPAPGRAPFDGRLAAIGLVILAIGVAAGLVAAPGRNSSSRISTASPLLADAPSVPSTAAEHAAASADPAAPRSAASLSPTTVAVSAPRPTVPSPPAASATASATTSASTSATTPASTAPTSPAAATSAPAAVTEAVAGVPSGFVTVAAAGTEGTPGTPVVATDGYRLDVLHLRPAPGSGWAGTAQIANTGSKARLATFVVTLRRQGLQAAVLRTLPVLVPAHRTLMVPVLSADPFTPGVFTVQLELAAP